MSKESVLVQTFVELTDALVDEFDVVDLLSRLTDGCVEVLDVTAAGLLLVDPAGELRVVASSSEAMHTLELFELHSAEGPCFECFHTGKAITNAQLATTDQPWAKFGPRAIASGFVSVTALPLRLRGQTIGALGLFRSDARVLSERDLIAAQAFADVATIPILKHRAVDEAHTLNDQLAAELNSAIIIEQAKGVVAERTGVDIVNAFNKLRGHALSHKAGLSDLAAHVVAGTVSAAALDAQDAPDETTSPTMTIAPTIDRGSCPTTAMVEPVITDMCTFDLGIDRLRIAVGVNDVVIRHLFSIGLSLHTTRTMVPDSARDRLDATISELDATIGELRSLIFDLETGARDLLIRDGRLL
ncbi:MAG: GAF domain-containing protein [Acidimicrobiales bacterium]